MPDDWGWNPGTFQAIGTVAVGIATLAVVVWATWVARTQKAISERALNVAGQQAEASFGLAKNQIRPVVQLRYHFQEHAALGKQIGLIAENVGVGPAINLEFWLECPGFDRFKDREFHFTRMILSPVNSIEEVVSEKSEQFADGRHVPGTGAGAIPTLKDGAWVIAQYENIDGNLFDSRISIDFGNPYNLRMMYEEIRRDRDNRITVPQFEPVLGTY